ncbi:hypothetical protein [uncultured Bacteroides sp.]|uniref:hypothetical protein n=1 Tax=uncultured Bacteroides sp. TaxID=162156 RepID=UPI00260AD1AF|nr:hypothetical protein [uncultured Bacteroides sp.]
MGAVDVGTIESFGFGNDPIVIRKYIAGVKGGKVLDVSSFKGEYIRAGHVIIRDTASDTYKPMPLNSGGNAYDSLPGSHEYVGVCVATKSVKEPFVSIMHTGVVNDKASPYPLDSIKTALKTAVPTLVFEHD